MMLSYALSCFANFFNSLQETYEAKRNEFLGELQKKEEEMRQMFVMRVKEKEAELKEAEKEVSCPVCRPGAESGILSAGCVNEASQQYRVVPLPRYHKSSFPTRQGMLANILVPI